MGGDPVESNEWQLLRLSCAWFVRLDLAGSLGLTGW
jgi:hypothetical protein